MKRWLCVTIALLLSTVAMAEEEEPAIEGARELEIGEVYSIDLDGDGTEETVRAWMQGYADEENLQLEVETDELIYTYDTYIMYSERAYVQDLDGDGRPEVLLCGDEASADYFTWCLKFDPEAGLQCVPFADANRGENTGEYFDYGYGRIDAVDGNVLTLTGSQDALGTWWCARQFTLRDGRFELDDGGVWKVVEDLDPDEWEFRSLRPVRELAVTMEDGSAGTLGPGDRFRITETDKVSFVGFQTEDGRRGTIAVAPDVEEGWGFTIDGISEYEYFEEIPYAD